MTTKSLSLTVLSVLCFVAFVAFVLHDAKRSQVVKREDEKPLFLKGGLTVMDVDDLRIGGTRIRLCGVLYSRPPQLRSDVVSVMKRDFEGRTFECRQVGAGTPCDGRSAAVFKGLPVMQCLDGDVDLALALAREKLLCGAQALTDGYYPSC